MEDDNVSDLRRLVYETAVAHFESRSIRVSLLPDDYCIITHFSSKIGTYPSMFIVHDDHFEFRASYGVKAPKESRPSIACALMAASYGLRIGTFFLDERDGEFGFRATAAFDADHMPSDELLTRYISPTLMTIDHFGPLLIKIAFGSIPPENAAQFFREFQDLGGMRQNSSKDDDENEEEAGQSSDENFDLGDMEED